MWLIDILGNYSRQTNDCSMLLCDMSSKMKYWGNADEAAVNIQSFISATSAVI